MWMKTTKILRLQLLVQVEKYLGVDVTIISPYTFAYYPRLSEDDFVFVISQSGYSKNALDALDVLKKLNRKTIALTGDLNSDIKNHADVVIGYVDEEKEGYTKVAFFFYAF